jgi:hypothetical protein
MLFVCAEAVREVFIRFTPLRALYINILENSCYSNKKAPIRMAPYTYILQLGGTGLEPVTPCMSSRYSNQTELTALLINGENLSFERSRSHLDARVFLKIKMYPI